MRFASFQSGGFITAIVVNPPERKLTKRTSVHCATWNSNLLKSLRNAMKINSSAVNLSFQIQHRSTKSFIVSKSLNCFITKFFNFFHHWNTKRFLPGINFVFWTFVKVLICIHFFKGCLFSEGTYFLFLFHPQKNVCTLNFLIIRLLIAKYWVEKIYFFKTLFCLLNYVYCFSIRDGARLELVSKELNHLAVILHVYAGGLNFMK